jgi:hypothetical protein
VQVLLEPSILCASANTPGTLGVFGRTFG